jgi:hypothetical protein
MSKDEIDGNFAIRTLPTASTFSRFMNPTFTTADY